MTDKKNLLELSVTVNGETEKLYTVYESPEEIANHLLGEDGIAGWLRGTPIRSLLMGHFSG